MARLPLALLLAALFSLSACCDKYLVDEEVPPEASAEPLAEGPSAPAELDATGSPSR